jgi:hypothetical protein
LFFFIATLLQQDKEKGGSQCPPLWLFRNVYCSKKKRVATLCFFYNICCNMKRQGVRDGPLCLFCNIASAATKGRGRGHDGSPYVFFLVALAVARGRVGVRWPPICVFCNTCYKRKKIDVDFFSIFFSR